MIRLQGRKAVVLGGINGLLGQALVQALEAEGAVVAAAGRSQVDVTDENDLDAYFERVDPEMVFNAVAYTAVDQAEDEPAVAALLNAEVPAILGRLCQKRGILLVHYSTDFVFGCAEETPRREEDIPSPASVYGRTKLDGEQALLALGYDNLLILRTAWLFGPGKTNFVHKILGFAATRDELTVVHDQAGSPTFTPDLAAYSLDLIRHGARGLFHVTNSGRASWCELAAEAVAASGRPCRVTPVPSSAYPTKATRPSYSVLDTTAFTEATGITPRPWPQALRIYVHALVAEELPE